MRTKDLEASDLAAAVSKAQVQLREAEAALQQVRSPSSLPLRSLLMPTAASSGVGVKQYSLMLVRVSGTETCWSRTFAHA